MPAEAGVRYSKVLNMYNMSHTIKRRVPLRLRKAHLKIQISALVLINIIWREVAGQDLFRYTGQSDREL